MSAPAPVPPRRRGACPALSAPMQTGDGLLVRLVPESGALDLTALAGLARAAQLCGNGILEVTARGSLQMRGLSRATLPTLVETVTALGISAREGLSIALSPLSGMDASERRDGRALARAILEGVSDAGLHGRLGPKVSVVIDGGGAVTLDTLKADIRLLARADGRWGFELASDGQTAVLDGDATEEEAAARVVDHLGRIANWGPDARMTDLLKDAPRAAVTTSGGRPAAAGQALALRNGTFALPLALAFGSTDSGAMIALADTARAHGVLDMRPAPARLLLATGLAADQVEPFRAAAGALGFIVDPRDPRLFVAACPGAPRCASGLLTSRAVAGEVARALAPLLDGTAEIHLSGCSKGCAHPAPATLTLVGIQREGMDSALALVRHGTAGSTPQAVFPVSRLPQFLALAPALAQKGGTGAAALERLAAMMEPCEG
ncbi:MAG: precorrin-3B synthase [Pseudomonadota bacterium]